MKSELWVTEQTKGYMKTSFRVEKTLFSGRSPFQSVDVVECPFYGRMLLNDGLVMVSEKDEFVYHDMIAHVPLFVHPEPRDVLVIGGGDGGTAREVLRHPGVESCTMVEIDRMVVEACREHIPLTASVLDGSDPRLDLVIGDGVAFVRETGKKFDVVLVDSTDPIGPATPLFGPEFYDDVFSVLKDDGIVVSQGESPWHEVEVQRSLMGILHGRFPSRSSTPSPTSPTARDCGLLPSLPRACIRCGIFAASALPGAASRSPTTTPRSTGQRSRCRTLSRKIWANFSGGDLLCSTGSSNPNRPSSPSTISQTLPRAPTTGTG